MNKLTKGLGALVIALSLTVPALASDIKDKLTPKDYRKQEYIMKEGIMLFGNHETYAIDYDVNDDGIPDVGELYLILSRNPLMTPIEPFMFAFNFNQNTVYEAIERFYDIKQDGWNGNEVPYIDAIEKIQDKKLRGKAI